MKMVLFDSGRVDSRSSLDGPGTGCAGAVAACCGLEMMIVGASLAQGTCWVCRSRPDRAALASARLGCLNAYSMPAQDKVSRALST